MTMTTELVQLVDCPLCVGVTWTAILIGMTLGLLASGVQILMHTPGMHRIAKITRLIGGVLGGLFAATTIGAGEITTADLVLMLLVGYVVADLLAAVLGVDP